MKINYNVTGSDRKQLVSIITHETGVKATYKGMPSMAYCIDGITIEKDGTMVWDENTDAATIQKITEALAAAGFEGEFTVGSTFASCDTEFFLKLVVDIA